MQDATHWTVRLAMIIPLLPLAAAAVSAFYKKRWRRQASNTAALMMAAACVLALAVFKGSLERGEAPDAPAPELRKTRHAGMKAADEDAHEAHAGQDLHLPQAAAHAEAGHGAPPGHHEPFRQVCNFVWFTVGGSQVHIGFLVDPMTAMMLVVVTVVSLLVILYSTGYMHDDANYQRFFCFLSLFSAAMLGLVVSNNILVLFMCWELVGLCSYLLIGFWFHKPSAQEAAKKAFMVTRVGDMGLFIGLLVLYFYCNTLLLYGSDGLPGILDSSKLLELKGMTFSIGVFHKVLFANVAVANVAAVLLFIGAMGKSAQFPFHVWLPDAMEGPTSVSALIHAATMVAAGVFMVGRMYPIFDLHTMDPHHPSAALTFVMWIGGITALFAATIAVAQNDIKKVLAYSTISQLGYMMLGLGSLGLVAGMFHLMTHAFFKALLFLGSGSVIHGCHGEQDMLKMGGLKKAMPRTFWTYCIGYLALAGLPPLAGFWSKDEILLGASHMFTKGPYVLGVIAAFLTPFYMTRQMYLVFGGERRSHDYHPHESAASMTVPLMVLAVFAVGAGWFGIPWEVFGVDQPNWFSEYLAPGHVHNMEGALTVMGSSVLIGLAGIAAGWFVYGRSSNPLVDGVDPLKRLMGGFYELPEKKYYLDEIYHALFVRTAHAGAAFFGWLDRIVIDTFLVRGTSYFTLGLSHVLFGLLDKVAINGGFDFGCDTIKKSGRWMSRMQSGRVQEYLFVLSVGILAVYLVYMMI